MRPFLTRVIAFVLVQGVIFATFWRPTMPFENDYLAATIDKHRRLRHTASPRIILVGGSNLAFGIRSKLLEEQTGRPIVNMGLYWRLGIDFMLREVEKEIRSGDIIVLSFEHEIFSAPSTQLLASRILEVRPASIFLFPPSEWTRIIDERGFAIAGAIARSALVRKFERPAPHVEGAYRREDFDRQGSYIGHYGRQSSGGKDDIKNVRPISDPIRAHIQQFAKLCQDRGALCIYSCPPHPNAPLASIRDKVEVNLADLKNIPNLVVLDSPLDHSYPESLFYDSVYHLSAEGAELRTRKVAQALQPFLNETRLASRAEPPRAY